MFTPASVVNVSCGFDVLGFCLDTIGDIMRVSKTENPGVTIGTVTGQELPKDPLKNVASVAAYSLLKAHSPNNGFNIDIEKRIKKPNGLARVIMISPDGLQGKNTFSTKISENPSMEDILEQLLRVLNSYEEFDLSQAIFIIKFYDIPQGGAGVKCPSWLVDKKKSVFIIENDDDYCGHRCLVLGVANANRQKYLRSNKKLLETEFNESKKVRTSKVKEFMQSTWKGFERQQLTSMLQTENTSYPVDKLKNIAKVVIKIFISLDFFIIFLG